MEAALDAGAEDFVREEDTYVITTDPTQLHAVKSALEERGLKPADAEVSWIPKTTVRVEGETAQQLLKLLEGLEELDDVQKVDSNFEMDAAEMAKA
jgi:transcriptional/translational regulatory protein YebC/TACO1